MLSPATLAVLLLAAAAATTNFDVAVAAPAAYVRPSLQNNPLHRRLQSSAPGLPAFYQPDATADFSGATIPAASDPTNPMSASALAEMGMSALTTAMGMTDSDVQMTSSFVDEATNLSFVHATQMVDGLPVANAVATVTTDMQGNMLAMTHSFMDMSTVAALKRRNALSRRDAVSVEVAVANIGALLGLSTDSLVVTTDATTGVTTVSGASWASTIKVQNVQYITPAGEMTPSYFLNVPALGTVYNCYVSTASGEVLGCSNLSSSAFHNLDSGAFEASLQEAALQQGNKADSDLEHLQRRQAAAPVTTTATQPASVSYKVVPFNFFSIDQIGGNTMVVSNPSDAAASPNGWHSQLSAAGTTQFVNAPFGNNVFAANNSLNSQTPLTIPLAFPTPAFQFLYTSDLVNAPNATMQNTQAGVTNMFYAANIMHDLYFHYGFTEAAGNFQLVNYAGAGVANDPVVATAQDGSGVNNANFLTQQDGVAGRMRMFIFTTTKPNRDGALDNGIVMHEMTHGLSNRLTGGPANANCLQTIQAGGMGEGWSDIVAVMMNVATTDTRATNKVVGAYAIGNVAGVRQFPYSTSLTTNTHMYADVGLKANQEVHIIGEVWCTMLYEVYWNMVDQAGFTPVTNLINAAAVGTAGNSDFFLILVRGMMLQPCNPTFLQARDAIVAADKALTGGKYMCAIWQGFAKRGMGVNAVAFTNNFDLPAGCTGTTATTTTAAAAATGGALAPAQPAAAVAQNQFKYGW